MCGACIAVERDEKNQIYWEGCDTRVRNPGVCVCSFFLGTMYGWDSCPAPHHAQLTDRRNARGRGKGRLKMRDEGIK